MQMGSTTSMRQLETTRRMCFVLYRCLVITLCCCTSGTFSVQSLEQLVHVGKTQRNCKFNADGKYNVHVTIRNNAPRAVLYPLSLSCNYFTLLHIRHILCSEFGAVGACRKNPTELQVQCRWQVPRPCDN